MNPEDMANFIKSLNPEQMAQFQQVFKTIGDTMDVKTKEEPQREETVSSKPQSNVTEDFRVVRNNDNDLGKRKTPVRAKKNQWVDNGEDRDPNFDPEKYERMGKASRDRGKVKKRTVECHVCGRSFQINPALVHGEYIRCNRCTGR